MTFPSFLPPNATQLELDLEGSMAQWLDTELLSTIWSPDNCPSDFIPWLAWALSIDVWDAEWLEERKREMLRRSIEIHKHKGTRWAIKELLTLVGVPEFELLEWFELNPQGVPHTFFIEIVSNPGFDPYILDYEQYQRIKKLIETVKPERSQFGFSVRTEFGNTEPPIYDPDSGHIDGSGIVTAGALSVSRVKIIDALVQGKHRVDLGNLSGKSPAIGNVSVGFNFHLKGAFVGKNSIPSQNNIGIGNVFSSYSFQTKQATTGKNNIPSQNNIGIGNVFSSVQHQTSCARAKQKPLSGLNQFGVQNNLETTQFKHTTFDIAIAQYLIDDEGLAVLDDEGNFIPVI